MLASAARARAQQRKLADKAVREGRRRARRGSRTVAQMLVAYQADAISVALQATPQMLDEQGIPLDAAGVVDLRSLLTPIPASSSMLEKAATQEAFDRLISTLVLDAGRTATTVDLAVRPAVTGYVRVLSGSSCGRCAVLAGRVYRWSTGFRRHPRCDCQMVPTTQELGSGLATDPMEAFREGRIHDLSRADTKAINLGADISQVVNVRRKQAGLTVGGSVIQRGSRPTPAGVLRVATDQDDAVRLLRHYGYIT